MTVTGGTNGITAIGQYALTVKNTSSFGHSHGLQVNTNTNGHVLGLINTSVNTPDYYIWAGTTIDDTLGTEQFGVTGAGNIEMTGTSSHSINVLNTPFGGNGGTLTINAGDSVNGVFGNGTGGGIRLNAGIGSGGQIGGNIRLEPGTGGAGGSIILNGSASGGSVTVGSTTVCGYDLCVKDGSQLLGTSTHVGAQITGGASISSGIAGRVGLAVTGAANITGLLTLNTGISVVGGGTITGGATITGGLTSSLATSASVKAVCRNTSGPNFLFVQCGGNPTGDYAEMYPAKAGVEVGDVVAQGSLQVPTYMATDNGPDWNAVKGNISQVVPAATPYSARQLGVVSDNYGDFISTGYNIRPTDNPKSIALNGRVLVKISTENGDIVPGDFLTASATHPGYAMKATQAGYVIGQALAPYSDPTPGMVMVFVGNQYYPGPTITDSIQNGGNGTLAQLNVTGSANVADLNVSGAATLASLTVSGAATFNGAVTVNADSTFNGSLSVNGHIITGNKTGNTTVVAGAAACTAPTVTISGNDSSGTVTITTGTGCSAVTTPGPLATVTFASAYGASPRVTLTPASPAAAKLQYYYGPTATPNATFEIDTNTVPANATTYQYNYLVAQ